MERRVTEYLRKNFFFAVLEVPDPEDRRALERKLIATVSLCPGCAPSDDWLGLASPEQKIRESGLWQTQHLYKETTWSGES